MQTFIVRRPNIAATAAELNAVLTRFRSFEEEPHSLDARWIRSYALREADGRFGLACVVQSDSAQTLQRHAELTKAPAQQILPVAAKVIVCPFSPTMVYLIRRRKFWSTNTLGPRSTVMLRSHGVRLTKRVCASRCTRAAAGTPTISAPCL